MTIKLSICIPTYNRANLLRETLETIFSQVRPEVEVVVCDNASTDDTPLVVAEYRETFGQVHYFRWEENKGFDRNILKVVEEAKGEYCWLLGDDDHLLPGAVDRILQLVSHDYSLIYANALTYDQEMKRSSGETLSLFDATDAERTLYSISSWLTFVSSLCVRRTDFLTFLESGFAHMGSGFAHCYPLVNLILLGKNHIVREPLLKFRAGNTGGYNIFRMFIDEFGLILEYCREIGFSPQTIARVKTRNVYLVIVPALIQIKLGRLNLKGDRAWHYLRGSGLGFRERLLLLALAWSPSFPFLLVNWLRALLR